MIALAVLLGSANGQSEPPEANPARPTVSTPALLPPAGYLQFETGWLSAWHSGEFSSRHSVNEVAKLAFNDRIEALVSWEPYVHATSAGAISNNLSDVLVGTQLVLHKSEGPLPSIAASYFHHAYAGSAPDLDVGTPENAGELLFSGDAGFHYDCDFYLNEQKSAAIRRLQFGESLSISHKLRGPVSIAGELWEFSQPFLQGRAAGNLWALSYTARPNLVFDAGFNRGLTSTSTRWQVFGGVTYLLPKRLWRK